MSRTPFARLLGALAVTVALLVGAWPATAQTTATNHYVARLQDPNNPSTYILVAAVVDQDGWAAVGAASNSDAWNAQHARIYRGRFIDGSFVGLAADGTPLTLSRQGTNVQGTVAGQSFTAQLLTGGAAGVWVGGSSQDLVAIIQAPDGTRVGRVWSRATGEHKRTLLFDTPRTSAADSLRALSVADAPASAQVTATITDLPNGVRQVVTPDVTYDTSWCSNSFCTGGGA